MGSNKRPNVIELQEEKESYPARAFCNYDCEFYLLLEVLS